MEDKKEIKKGSKKESKRTIAQILKLARFFLVILLLFLSVLYLREKFTKPAEPELTSSFINGKLEAVSELTTSELVYTGLIKYSEGNIPFLTQNSFSMIYTAKVRAGIDLSRAKVAITDTQVVITLPECEVQSIDIDPDSIEFYDEHWALFNWSEKKDVTDTISAAKEDVEQKADLESLLENARHQTDLLIKNLLEETVGDKKLVMK